jgi:ABC-type nickel/cobalt efflux system permease component RcnA
MLETTTYLLLVTAAATALFHTLIPDHWLPFVLIGKARKWSARTTALVSGFSALIHATLSVGLGLLALGVGITAASAIGETLEHAGAALLIVFGLVYAWWAWRKGGHFHPGGKFLHGHDHGAACGGSEGDANPEHLHYHADEGLIRGSAGWGGLGLALIVGMNPCVLILPIMLATLDRGPLVFWLVTASYVIPTVALMVGLSVVGVAGGRKIPVPGIARHMEWVSGLLIALLGVGFWLLGE